MRTRSGAWVRRARLQAALGSPMPTKHTAPLRSCRAAVTVIISSLLYSGALMRGSRGDAERAQERRMIGQAEHVAVHPRAEGGAVARDLIPCEVEGVVARIVTVCVGRIGAA